MEAFPDQTTSILPQGLTGPEKIYIKTWSVVALHFPIVVNMMHAAKGIRCSGHARTVDLRRGVPGGRLVLGVARQAAEQAKLQQQRAGARRARDPRLPGRHALSLGMEG